MNIELLNEKVLPVADQLTVLSPVVDNLICEVDSTVRAGYGACSKQWCNCQQYEGNASTCGNSGCGHAYGDHW